LLTAPYQPLQFNMTNQNQPQPGDCSFPKSRRLAKQAHFDQVFAGKRFVADHCLVISYREHPETENQPTRLGLSVGRKVGNAVVRNRWKRRIREAFRQLQPELSEGLDLVVRPRLGATCDFHQIRVSLSGLMKKIQRKR
jgi:ribonuclease P protein component